MIKLNDNMWFDSTTGIIIERNMLDKTSTILKSIHSIAKLECPKDVKILADMILIDLEGVSGKKHPRVEDVPKPTIKQTQSQSQQITVGKKEEEKDGKDNSK